NGFVIVTRETEKALALFLHDTDDDIFQVLYFDRLPYRVLVRKQFLGDLITDQGDIASGRNFLRREITTVFDGHFEYHIVTRTAARQVHITDAVAPVFHGLTTPP